MDDLKQYKNFQELQVYWTFREEMTVEDGLILKATRIVIPPSMGETILQWWSLCRQRISASNPLFILGMYMWGFLL